MDSAASPKFGLAEWIDLQAQLAVDADHGGAGTYERDHRIGRNIGAKSLERRVALRGWVSAIRQGQSLPGKTLTRSLSNANLLLYVLGFLAGTSAAYGALHFTGEHPVNVIVVLVVFVLIQILLVLFTLIITTISIVSPNVFLNAPLIALLRGLVSKLSQRALRRLSSADSSNWLESLGWLRGRHTLLVNAERWMLFSMLQRAAVAFNIGAIAVFLGTVLFTDLAFGWSTTLSFGASEFHRFCAWLSSPWAALFPDAVPSEPLVQATQYFRFNRAYVGAPAGMRAIDPSMSGQWWPFLLAMVVYGLLPRLLMLWVGSTEVFECREPCSFGYSRRRRLDASPRRSACRCRRTGGSWKRHPAWAWLRTAQVCIADERGRKNSVCALARRRR
ncbi:MAG: DUF2868 domain-containing protein [Polyangiales bacterium]